MREHPSSSDLLADLYRAHHGSLRWYAQSLTHSEDEAAEVVQDVFAHFAEHADVLERQQNPVSFLFRSIRNHALNRMRRERAVHQTIERYAADLRAARRVATNEGETALFLEDIEAWCARLVDRLPARQREVFSLVRLSGLSYTEVARLLGVRFTTINTHVTRATHAIASGFGDLELLDGSIQPMTRSSESLIDDRAVSSPMVEATDTSSEGKKCQRMRSRRRRP